VQIFWDRLRGVLVRALGLFHQNFVLPITRLTHFAYSRKFGFVGSLMAASFLLLFAFIGLRVAWVERTSRLRGDGCTHHCSSVRSILNIAGGEAERWPYRGCPAVDLAWGQSLLGQPVTAGLWSLLTRIADSKSPRRKDAERQGFALLAINSCHEAEIFSLSDQPGAATCRPGSLGSKELTTRSQAPGR